MTETMHNRIAGTAAIIAGVLRAIDAFAFKILATAETDLLFLTTDIFLLFAMLGLYARFGRAVGLAGLAGIGVAIVGIVIMRGGAGIIDTYILGTAVLAIGIAVLSAAMLAQRAIPRAAPVLWIAGLVIGVISYLLESDWLFETASVVFGAGFVVAGVEMVRLRPAAV